MNQLGRTIGSIFMLIIIGSIMISSINDNCRYLLFPDCSMLWAVSIISIFGGIWLTETFVTGTRAQLHNKEKEPNIESTQKQPSPSVWTRSIIRIMLTSIILSLPIIAQGAFISLVCGLGIGSSLDIAIRGLANKLPPPAWMKEDQQSK